MLMTNLIKVRNFFLRASIQANIPPKTIWFTITHLFLNQPPNLAPTLMQVIPKLRAPSISALKKTLLPQIFPRQDLTTHILGIRH